MIGRVVTATDVQNAVKTLFAARVGGPDGPTLTQFYLTEIGVQSDPANPRELPDFRSITTANDTDSGKWLEDQLPAAIVICPGMAEKPRKHGKDWSARWALGIGAVVSAGTRSDTEDLVRLYTGAMRALILQHGSLGGFSNGVELQDERYNELPSEDSRTIAGGQVLFVVDVDHVVDSQGGPDDPIDIESVLVSIEPKEA